MVKEPQHYVTFKFKSRSLKLLPKKLSLQLVDCSCKQKLVDKSNNTEKEGQKDDKHKK